MALQFCRIFPSEYGYEYTEKQQDKVPLYIQPDCIGNRIEDWELDPKLISKSHSIDENTKKLLNDHIKERLKSVYQISYKNPWTWDIDANFHPAQKSKDKRKATEKQSNDIEVEDFSNQILENFRQLYYNPHTEKVLPPPVCAKRTMGYLRPKLLHATFSTYQDTHGRLGGKILINNSKKMAFVKRREAFKIKQLQHKELLQSKSREFF